jgi:hypothetical protein
MGISPTVRKEELLKILEENRAKHRRVFEAALAGWRKEAIAQVKATEARLLAGKNRSVQISMLMPRDHTADYDRAIRSVRMHTEDKIRLSEQDVAQYVEDDWGWRREFNRSASTYASADFMEVYGVEADDD